MDREDCQAVFPLSESVEDDGCAAMWIGFPECFSGVPAVFLYNHVRK